MPKQFSSSLPAPLFFYIPPYRQVPVLSVVENMAYFECRNGERHRPFGPGHARQLVDDCGIGEDSVFSLPLSPAVATGSDTGDPIVLSDPEGDEAQVRGGGTMMMF